MLKRLKKLLFLNRIDSRSLHYFDLNENKINKQFVFFKSDKKLSEEAIYRIFSFSQRLKKDEKNFKKEDLWDSIISHEDHLRLINYCLKEEKTNFENLISLCNKTNLTKGFLNYYSYNDLQSSKKNRNKETTQFLDKLISLAEYRKLTQVFNPEQGKWLLSDLNFTNILENIFNYKSKNIKPFLSPNFTYGLQHQNNFYCLKDLKSLYTAIKTEELSRIYKFDQISEIGSGLGYLPYYSYILNNLNYNVYDLPNILILQAYFLMISLGEEKIHLYGESKNKGKQISLLPYWEIFNENENKILWISQDSIPEIDLNLSKKFFDKISKCNSSYFLSINQESKNINVAGTIQEPVYSIIRGINNFKLLNRSRDFLRKGYIEEFYMIR